MALTYICRDCLHTGVSAQESCPNCMSERLVRHPQLDDFTLAHLDCDAFYAAVEKRDNPEIAPHPVIVGGGKRGVVATCCYIARAYGVRSAMPMFKALKACPNAIVVKPRMDHYAAEGKKMRELMRSLTPLVEPISIDEAFMDLSGLEKLHGCSPAESLVKLQNQIESELKITVSVGLSVNKFLAKTASDLDKPRGFSVLSQEDAVRFLADKSPRAIHGVGPKLMEKLELDGFFTIADLQTADLKQLVTKYGETGMWLKDRSLGKDSRTVQSSGQRKSVSSETTFMEDVRDLEKLTDTLWWLSQKVADRAKRANCEGKTVNIKLKTANFKTITRQVSLNSPTQLAQAIFRAARPLLEKAAQGQSFRLLGVGISELVDALPVEAAQDFGDLADPKAAKRAAAERAMDKARAKFGSDAVKTGRSARSQKD